MPLLANPFSIGQLNSSTATLVGNMVVSWQKGSDATEAETHAVRALFDETKAQQRNETWSDFDYRDLSHKSGDGEDYRFVSRIQGDAASTTQMKRTARVKLTEDLLEFNKYPEIDARLRLVGGDLWRGYLLDLTHRFTFAFDTSYTDRDGETVTTTGGDTAALCANTHTMNDGSTYDNLISSRLSESALEDADDLGTLMIGHSGMRMPTRFNVLITGPHAATRHMAERLTQQSTQEGGDFTNMNVYKGKMRHVVLEWLDTTATLGSNTAKSRFWFTMDTRQKENLKARVHKFPQIDGMTKDPDNNNIQMKGAMWYDLTHLNAHFLVGSNAV